MIVSYDQIKIKIDNFIKEYEQMNINGVVIKCPYWMNKIKDNKVILRGFGNGKGKAGEIKAAIIDKLEVLENGQTQPITPEFLKKLAKRNKIGIDCSGFAYRVLENLAGLHYMSCKVSSLDEVFSDGINKTDVWKLTSLQYAVPIKTVSDIRLGDMVRMMSGKHVLIICKVTNSDIHYVHSSQLTKIQGVHQGEIRIIDMNKSLDSQQWLEEARNGLNFGLRYYHRDQGDGIYRLKIFK